MGTSSSHPIFLALNELLLTKDLKIKKGTLQRFLEECDVVAPWFAVSGSLTVSSWEKLGRDLDFAAEQGTLKPGVRPVWRLVCGCLEDQRCSNALESIQATLEQLQEERSEKAGSEKAESEKSKGKEVESLVRSLQKVKIKNKVRKKDKRKGDYGSIIPSAPPPYPEAAAAPGASLVSSSLHPQLWREVRREMQVACPVFVDNQNQRYHEPLDFKFVKSIAESVKSYSVTAAFTLTQIETLQRQCMTASDWMNLARACLSPGQYLDWKAFFIEFANEQAAANHNTGLQWDADMLLGLGRYVNQQTTYPPNVYTQINQIAIRAWKSLPNKGEVSGNLTKILQGPMEPFSDFVARLIEAAGRIFGDTDASMPLIKQLIYEQCTKECRAAITPYKARGLEAWMKACRELGGPLTNAGLAAAVLQLTQRKESNTQNACFKCGKRGHIRHNCPLGVGSKQEQGSSQRCIQPGLCPKCRKGRHWANECWSVKDINGQPIAVDSFPKNGQRGPRSQGPQIYGAMETPRQDSPPEQWPSLRHPKHRGEPMRAQQDWTSVPPPDSY
ncbi:endogenous retrovirus group K member 21 Gag polyprotein-like [Peromyscus californicus insignis]|uniref:endogenous retrovirus group K member 21 Gag polyprotein-like n=1 Tax=Peromyscus californicus insignis TaxID=564181 RepID=UPI0022A78754|nr:endogenous retrovirus group K member 21 Gag polyprotein-like [Peromyscus californicus insignis]